MASEGWSIGGRRPNAWQSSSFAEIVSLVAPDGGRTDLFLKYDRPESDPEPRCRRGLTYCWTVYDRVVRHLPLPAARVYGLVRAGDAESPILVLGHLGDCLRVNESADESGVLAAAAWCGRLHEWGLATVADPSLAFLARHDPEYHRAWATRAVGLAATVGETSDALVAACRAYAERAPILVGDERTVIHGEFGPQNVLWRDGQAYPVDWESAAVGPGVIDLATLLFGWPAETVVRGIAAYWEARGEREPAGFGRVFALATVYTALRWLPDPACQPRDRWRAGLERIVSAAGPGLA